MVAATPLRAGGASRRGSHKLSDANSCEVRWYWAYHERLSSIEPKGNYYRDFGTLVHTMLAYYYAEMMERKPAWYLASSDPTEQIELDSKGHPEWIRQAKEIMKAYISKFKGDPWTPIYCEEEFESTVGIIDPEGKDEPEEFIEYEGDCDDCEDPNYLDRVTDILGDTIEIHIPHRAKKILHLPTLNSEIITCRPDLIVSSNGMNLMIDHKTASGAKNGSGRLPVTNPNFPDYKYTWQALVNLHVVRQKMEILGFYFNRIKRDIPYDFGRDEAEIKLNTYNAAPAAIRDCVKKEREIKRKIIRGEGLVPHYFECQGAYTCGYTSLCYTDSKQEQDLAKAMGYQTVER